MTTAKTIYGMVGLSRIDSNQDENKFVADLIELNDIYQVTENENQ